MKPSVKATIGLSAALTLFFAAPFIPKIQAADPVAYVSSSSQDVIAAYDPSTGHTAKIANGGINSTGFTMSPDGRTAYVQSLNVPQAGADVDVIDIATGKLTGTITSVQTQTNVVVSPDSSSVYLVTNSGLNVISAATLQVLNQTPLYSCPCNMVLTPDGSTIYVGTSSHLSAFATNTLTQIASLNLGYTLGLSISPDGSTLYALTPDNGVMVSVVDTSSNTISGTVPNQSGVGSLAGTAISPDGATLYAAGTRGLIRIATATNTVMDQIQSPPLDGQITASPNGKFVYVNRVVAQFQEDSVDATAAGLLRFDTGTAAFSNISIGGPAIAEQVPAADGTVYILEGVNAIAVEDIASDTVTKGISTPGTYALTASSSGNTVAGITQFALSGISSASISLIDATTGTLAGQFTYPAPAQEPQSSRFPIALNANGTLAYFANSVLSDRQGFYEAEISVLKLPQGTLQQTFAVYNADAPEPACLRVSNNDSTLFVLMAAYGVGSAAKICNADLATMTTTACANLTIPTTIYDLTSSFVVSADGTRLYVPVSASTGGGYPNGLFLSEVDASSMSVLKILQIKGASQSTAVAYSAASNSVYLAIDSEQNVPGGALARVDLATYTVAVTTPLNYAPFGVAVTPDGTKLLVTGSLHDTQIFDGTSLAPIGSIAGGQQQAIVIPAQ